MEGLTVVGWLVGAMVFFGFVALVVIVYAWGIHWLWRERGKGFAEGWFEVAERRPGVARGVSSPRQPALSALDGAALPPPETPAPKSSAPEPEPTPQYTITGRRIR